MIKVTDTNGGFTYIPESHVSHVYVSSQDRQGSHLVISSVYSTGQAIFPLTRQTAIEVVALLQEYYDRQNETPTISVV